MFDRLSHSVNIDFMTSEGWKKGSTGKFHRAVPTKNKISGELYTYYLHNYHYPLVAIDISQCVLIYHAG